MRVMWDLDNVICATTESAMRWFHSQGKLLEFGWHDVKSFWWDNLPISRAEVDGAYQRRDVLYQADHNHDAIKAIRYLRETSEVNAGTIEQFIVTGRTVSSETPRLTKHWLHVRNIDLPLYFVSAERKADWCVENGIDFAIEDHLETACSLAERGIGVCLVEYPWNYRSFDTRLCSKMSVLGECSKHVRRQPLNKLTQYVSTAYNDPSSLHRSLWEIALEDSLRSSLRGMRYW